MNLDRTFRLESLPTGLSQRLDARDAAIWVSKSFVEAAGSEATATLLRLPWRLVLCESSDAGLISELEKAEAPNEPLVRRRGFVQIVDTNPADMLLPPRALPIFLLAGRPGVPTGGLSRLTRRLTMLDALRRLQLKELVVASHETPALPTELAELWDEGFRTVLTVVAHSEQAATEVESWRSARPFGATAAYLHLEPEKFCRELVQSYIESRQDDRATLKIRNVSGHTSLLDITGLDDPEHPVLANYELLQDRDLRALQADDLKADEVMDFFADTTRSWSPYAAGLPWERDNSASQTLNQRLRRLDRQGSDESRVMYINSEPGSGATTLARTLAWKAASDGYPTLIARSTPFVPKALELVRFITRILEVQRTHGVDERERRYEVPWLIVFDRMHWDGRMDELRPFLKEFIRSGRPVCVLIVSGPYREVAFYDGNSFVEVAALGQEVELEEAVNLGKHLNRYLRTHGPIRTEADWRSYFASHAVQAELEIATFWVALSFWVQRQFDLSETIQAWIYKQYKGSRASPDVQRAILDIAALSSQRRPLPETMLPPTVDWPVAQKLEDIRREVPALGLVRSTREGDGFWLMVHDVIGRYLTNALFYDRPALEAAGFGEALNPSHLRFLLLRRLSQMPALSLQSNRAIAEEFAVSIFKIDPDHGYAEFATIWREVLAALDDMPKAIRASSRSFRHHVAISRRRVAKLKDTFLIDGSERIQLLEQAIVDIRFALENINSSSDGETDLNLYNSLAHAYQDLEEEEIAAGASNERVAELRKLAHEATLRAYRSDPDNSFVVETYARSLLNDARAFPEKAAANAVEVLNIVYAAMDRDRSGQRKNSLARLAETAMASLISHPTSANGAEPANEIDALIRAIQALAAGVQKLEGMDLKDFPPANRVRAADLLSTSILLGNAQAVRLRYALRCIDAPRDFRGQLELLESLLDSGVTFSPQMRLELALLYQQCDRHHEAQRAFRELRRLWREGEHYVEVPDRLRWLMTIDGSAAKQVTARVLGTTDFRRAAKVRELQDTEVPFRTEEFGREDLRPGTTIRGYISFGHNGPFLRPTTASLN